MQYQTADNKNDKINRRIKFFVLYFLAKKGDNQNELYCISNIYIRGRA